MTVPNVTVLLPVRNGSEFLRAACESILTQDYDNFELLVVDDGSTDATPAILADLAREDRRMRFLSLPAVGLVGALNRGLAEARGAYVARMDADDLSLPNRLSIQAACLDRHPAVVLVGSAWQVIDRTGRVLRRMDVPTEPEAIRAGLRHRNCIAHPSVMLRREVVLAADGYRAAFRFAEDYDLWLRLSDHHDLMNVPDYLLSYREHPKQSTRVGLEQSILSELGARAAAERRRTDGAEPVLADGPMTRGALRHLGMTDPAIDAAVLARALGAAKGALRSHDAVTARSALSLARRQRTIPLRTRIHTGWLWVRAMLLGSRP